MDGESTDAHNIWHAIAARNDWQLVHDDPTFVAHATSDLAANADRGTIERALLHAYRRRLFAGLQAGDERAAEELRRTCYARARAGGLDAERAADTAQETMRRVLERLDTVRAPEAIVAWALLIQQSYLRDEAARKQAVSLEAAVAAGTIAEPATTDDAIDAVEWRVISMELAGIINGVLTNPMERIAIQRIVLGDEKPREVARDMAVPLHQIRVHKSRALQKLRADRTFMNACEQLATTPATFGAEEQTDDAA